MLLTIPGLSTMVRQANARASASPQVSRSASMKLLRAIGAAKQQAAAEDRYRRAMPDWTTTEEVERRLGYGRTVCNAYLRKLYASGRVERRNAGGAAKYCRWKGYEWRWKRRDPKC